MQRRAFLMMAAGNLLAAPLAVGAQKRDGRPAPPSRHNMCYLPCLVRSSVDGESVGLRNVAGTTHVLYGCK